MTALSFPQIDREQLDLFVRIVFRHADPGSWVQLRAFRDDKDGTWRSDVWPAVQINGDLGNVVEEAAAFAGECAAAPVKVVFAPPLATFKDALKAAEKDVSDGLTLSVECDQAPAAAREQLAAVIGSPTTVV